MINGVTNQQMGVMRIEEALRHARAIGLDLIEVAPGAQPPVCRIVDFGKFRYDLSKQEKEKKNSSGRVKEVKFRVNIDEHDYVTKIRHAEEFLDKGNKVKIHLQFRGREMAHQELGMEVVNRVRTIWPRWVCRYGAQTRRQSHRNDAFAATFEQTEAEIRQERRRSRS